MLICFYFCLLNGKRRGVSFIRKGGSGLIKLKGKQVWKIPKLWWDLRYSGRKPHCSSVQKHCRLLWVWARIKWAERQWKCVLWTVESRFVSASICKGTAVHQCPILAFQRDVCCHQGNAEQCWKERAMWRSNRGSELFCYHHVIMHIRSVLSDLMTSTFPQTAFMCGRGWPWLIHPRIKKE